MPRAAGIGELKFVSKIHYGGGAACATIQQAAIAVATGVADCVVAYRAFNERSGMRFGQVQTRLVENADSTGAGQFVLLSARAVHAGRAGGDDRQALHAPVRGDEPDFGAISVADRRHAAKNPKAYFYETADHH